MHGLAYRLPVAALAAIMALAGCASHPAPPPYAETPDLASPVAPERDEIIYHAALSGTALSGTTSRLAGHYERPATAATMRLGGTYLLGDRETPEMARQNLLDRLQREALLQSGAYQAVEERLSAQQRHSLERVSIAGSIVRARMLHEEMRPAGNGRSELFVEAAIEVDGSGLRRQIDALYDNHALRAASARLIEENQALRQRQPPYAAPSPAETPRATATVVADAPTAEARLQQDAHRNAHDVAVWLNDRNLLHSDDWVRAFDNPYRYGKPTYQPAGAEAIPQDKMAMERLRRGLLAPMSALVRDYDKALAVSVLSREAVARKSSGLDNTGHGPGTRYIVEVTGFAGFRDALLAETGLPFSGGQLSPEQIEQLDPWSALSYWVVADRLVQQPLVLSLTAYSESAPGRETPLGAFQQLVLAPAAFSHDRSTATPLRFTTLGAHLWYLGGSHLPHTGLVAPRGPYRIDGLTNQQGGSRYIRPLRAPEVLSFDPAQGRAVFRFVREDGEPPITSLAASLEHLDSDVLFPAGAWENHMKSRDLSRKEARARRTGAYF